MNTRDKGLDQGSFGMGNTNNANALLRLFNVSNYKELTEYIKNNPHDPRVKQLQEFLDMFSDKKEE